MEMESKFKAGDIAYYLEYTNMDTITVKAVEVEGTIFDVGEWHTMETVQTVDDGYHNAESLSHSPEEALAEFERYAQKSLDDVRDTFRARIRAIRACRVMLATPIDDTRTAEVGSKVIYLGHNSYGEFFRGDVYTIGNDGCGNIGPIDEFDDVRVDEHDKFGVIE